MSMSTPWRVSRGAIRSSRMSVSRPIARAVGSAVRINGTLARSASAVSSLGIVRPSRHHHAWQIAAEQPAQRLRAGVRGQLLEKFHLAFAKNEHAAGTEVFVEAGKRQARSSECRASAMRRSRPVDPAEQIEVEPTRPASGQERADAHGCGQRSGLWLNQSEMSVGASVQNADRFRGGVTEHQEVLTITAAQREHRIVETHGFDGRPARSNDARRRLRRHALSGRRQPPRAATARRRPSCGGGSSIDPSAAAPAARPCRRRATRARCKLRVTADAVQHMVLARVHGQFADEPAALLREHALRRDGTVVEKTIDPIEPASQSAAEPPR